MKARLTIIALAFGLVTAVVPTQQAGAATEQASAAVPILSFNATAQASGARYIFGAPGFIAVETFIDGGGPVAQSVLDGLGNSQSFAALPYPSDNAISGPGLVSGLTGLPSLPAYPFYVTSSYPTQQNAAFAAPGLDLAADSGELTTQGMAASGGGGGGAAIGSTVARTHTAQNVAAGTVTAVARVTADMIDIGGVLKIASAATSAEVTRGAGGEPVRTTSFVLDGVSIAGQAVGLNQNGFAIAGTNSPLPADSPLTEALRQAGIDVRYLAAQSTDNGVVSPGLVITQTLQFPDGPPLVFTYILGLATANVTVN